MRSRDLAAALAISLFAACGGSGYGDYEEDEADSQSDEREARDGGTGDARVKDGGAARADAGARADGGGAGSGGSDDDDDDGDVDGDGDGGEDDDDAADAGDGGGTDACATLTYQSFGKQFLSDYCVSCHGGSAPNGGVNLTSLANVVRRKAGVKTQVTSGGMPLGNKQPSAAERTRFGQWIDCGPK